MTRRTRRAGPAHTINSCVACQINCDKVLFDFAGASSVFAYNVDFFSMLYMFALYVLFSGVVLQPHRGVFSAPFACAIIIYTYIYRCSNVRSTLIM